MTQFRTQQSLNHVESVLSARAQYRASLARHVEHTELALAARYGVGRRSLAPSTLAVLLTAGMVVSLVCAAWVAL